MNNFGVGEQVFIGSALGGGKFANGAMTGAFVMLFNHVMHHQPQKKVLPSNDEVTKKLNLFAKKLRQQNYAQRKSKSITFWPDDFNFGGKIGDRNIFGLFRELPDYPIDLELGNETIGVIFEYTPSDNTKANYVSSITPTALNRNYNTKYPGYYSVVLNYHRAKIHWSVGVLYFNTEENYNKFLEYVKQP